MTDSETPLTKPGDHLPTLLFLDGSLSTAEKCAELGALRSPPKPMARRTLYNWWKAGKVQPLGRAPGSLAVRWSREGDG